MSAITGQLIFRKTAKPVDDRLVTAVFGMIAGIEGLEDGQYPVQGSDIGDFMSLTIVKDLSIPITELPKQYDGQRHDTMTFDQLMTSKIWRV